ncbi:MAG: hypothetical protein C0403_10345 [Desulfobacterium sp.]|nr:hypothetical protein [Desulfobacterium sp.]
MLSLPSQCNLPIHPSIFRPCLTGLVYWVYPIYKIDGFIMIHYSIFLPFTGMTADGIFEILQTHQKKDTPIKKRKIY